MLEKEKLQGIYWPQFSLSLKSFRYYLHIGGRVWVWTTFVNVAWPFAHNLCIVWTEELFGLANIAAAWQVSRDDHRVCTTNNYYQYQHLQLEAAQKAEAQTHFPWPWQKLSQIANSRRRRRCDVEKQLKVASSLWHATKRPSDRKRQPPFV